MLRLLSKASRLFIVLMGPILIVVASLLIALCAWFMLTSVVFVYFIVCIYFYYFMAIVVCSASAVDPAYQMCRKCGLARPPRTHHCGICRKCIHQMDHHCPWINNCVGANNFRYFYLFLVNVSIGCFLFAVMRYRLFYGLVFLDQQVEYPVSFTLAYLICSLLGIVLLGMTGWNTYLIGSAQTTIEYYHNQDMKEEGRLNGEYFFNEYDLGTKQNFVKFFDLDVLFVYLTIDPYGRY
jgi:hypothetical protein